MHFVLLWPHLDFTNIWKNHPGAHWRQVSLNAKHKTSFTTGPSSSPRKPSQPGMHLNPGQGLQPRDYAKVLLCNGAISWYWDRGHWKAAFSVHISQTRHPNRLVKFYQLWPYQGLGHPKENSVMIYNHRSRQPRIAQRDRDQDRGSDDVSAPKRNLKNLKSIWKDKKNAARSGKTASQRQIQKPGLFTDVMTDHKVSISTFESLDSTRATAQC